MSRMKAVQVGKAKGSFEMVERPIPEPDRGQVRIKVEACGICHSDAIVKEGSGRDCNIRGFQAMKSRDASTRLAPM
jgi:D-arabinose 1-dehydrogenase-like Zn-dependent alcohol dehydrogenase